MALSVLSVNKISLIVIGKDYMPSSIVLPYDANVRNAQTAKEQLNINVDFKNQLWQKIISKKIENQEKCLTEKQFCNCGLYQEEIDLQKDIVGKNDFIMLQLLTGMTTSNFWRGVILIKIRSN